MQKTTVEMLVAGLLMAAGVLVAADSARLGAGWASDGPQSGYFPFYIGLALAVASAVTLLRAILARHGGGIFAEREPARRVLSVLAPTAVFVAAIWVLGLYLAAAAYIAYFMRALGDYRLTVVAGVSLGVPLVFFVMFEFWFLVPLPKGPVERLLGF